MRCDWTRDRFDLYRKSELSDRESSRLEEHLEGCEPCRAVFEQEERLGALLRESLPAPSVPDEPHFAQLFRRIQSRLEEELEEEQVGASWNFGKLLWTLVAGEEGWARGFRGAVMVAAGVAIGVFLTQPQRQPLPSADRAFLPALSERPDSSQPNPLIEAASAQPSPRTQPTTSAVVEKGVNPPKTLPAEVAKSLNDLGTAEPAPYVQLAHELRESQLLEKLQQVKLELSQSGNRRLVSEFQQVENTLYDLAALDTSADKASLEAFRTYQTAEHQAFMKQYGEALRLFYQIARERPTSYLACLSRYQIGNIDYDLLEDYGNSLINYQQVVDNFPAEYLSEPQRTQVQSRLQLLVETAKYNWQPLRLYRNARSATGEEALAHDVEVIRLFPDTSLALESAKHLTEYGLTSNSGSLLTASEILRLIEKLQGLGLPADLTAQLQFSKAEILNFRLRNKSQALLEYGKVLEMTDKATLTSMVKTRMQTIYHSNADVGE